MEPDTPKENTADPTGTLLLRGFKGRERCWAVYHYRRKMGREQEKNDYKELYTNCADETLEEGMKRVTEWFKEREELMNVNKSPTAQEKKR